ncbi:LysR substrate-binding domain-containing protein [Opitutus sp. ER46]|uniref:LysR substrate-binding domain-containing protein n=1 Tax=Opitutus sp. ER46 TaxID=2161864 RepID=UPI000D307FD2|nr:LysR substrate-binding domain-containing protein [Opitutus sp. ER46]PTY00103.1 transcriptional regulator CynR [Opitutus sp. ER46]
MTAIKPGITELRHLRYFLAIAEAGQFRRAAAALRVSQPTLSHQIQQLELQMGAPLFERLSRTIRLTPAGVVLRERASTILRELGHASRAIAELQGLAAGELRVGAVATVDVALVPGAVALFHERHPKVSVSIRELPSDALEAELLAGRLDLGLGLLHARVGSPIETEPLFEERLVAVLPAGHPLQGQAAVELATIAREPLVLLCRGFCTRELVDEAAARLNVAVAARIELNSIATVLATVMRTALATLLPESSVRWSCHPSLQVVPLVHGRRPLRARRVGLLWVRGAHRTAAAVAFARAVREVVAAARAGSTPVAPLANAVASRPRRAAAQLAAALA